MNKEWSRSRKGNLWKRAGSLTCTVFQHKDGSYGWCVADGEGPEYSRESWPSEEQAVKAVEWEIERRAIALASLI